MSWLRKLRQLISPVAPSVAPAAPQALSLPEELFDQLQQQMAARFPELAVRRQQEFLWIESLAWHLEAAVLERTPHPNAVVLTLGFRLIHAVNFPEGVMEMLAGIGEDDAAAVQRGVEVYLEGVFEVLQTAQQGFHQPAHDVHLASGEVAWHPLLSTMHVQGAWAGRPAQIDEAAWWELLRPALLATLTPKAFHWLKIYASRMPDGEFIGECKLDNEPWEAGLTLLAEASAGWPFAGEFAAQKQFIVLRRCGEAGGAGE